MKTNFEAEAALGRADRVAREKRYAADRAAQLKPPPPTAAETAAEFAGLRKQSDRLAADIASVVTAVAKNPAPVPAPVVPDLPGGPDHVKSADPVHVAAIALLKTRPELGYQKAVEIVTTRRTP
jgi:hypothetical protein